MRCIVFNLLCLVLFCGNSIVAARQNTYVGVDVLYNHTNLQQSYGKNIFSTRGAAQFNIFIGHYFAQLLGFECGYAQSLTTNSSVFVPAATSQFGLTNFTGIASNNYATKKSLSGLYFSYVPMFMLVKNISLVPIIGVTLIKTIDDLNLTQFDGAVATNLEQSDYNVHFTTTKAIPRLGIMLQYIFWRHIGIRASYIWQKTSLLQPQATRNINLSQTLTAKLANSSAVGVGVLGIW